MTARVEQLAAQVLELPFEEREEFFSVLEAGLEDAPQPVHDVSDEEVDRRWQEILDDPEGATIPWKEFDKRMRKFLAN